MYMCVCVCVCVCVLVLGLLAEWNPSMICHDESYFTLEGCNKAQELLLVLVAFLFLGLHLHTQ